MSAGAAATASVWPVQAQSYTHYFDPTLPYQPRQLTRGERSRRDLYVYYSPRNRRIATLTEALNFALGLRLEFDTSLAAYVERPRRLALAPKRHIDISFWTCSHAGDERFYLTIPGNWAPSGSSMARDRELLDDAARRHGVQLTYVLEQELVLQGDQLSTYFRLLPYVQSTRRIVCRSTIRRGIEAYFAQLPRGSFRQLQQALNRFEPGHVTAVAAAMVHEGALLLERPAGLTPDSMLEVAHAHA